MMWTVISIVWPFVSMFAVYALVYLIIGKIFGASGNDKWVLIFSITFLLWQIIPQHYFGYVDLSYLPPYEKYIQHCVTQGLIIFIAVWAAIRLNRTKQD